MTGKQFMIGLKPPLKFALCMDDAARRRLLLRAGIQDRFLKGHERKAAGPRKMRVARALQLAQLFSSLPLTSEP